MPIKSVNSPGTAPWERRATETTPAWEAFVAYRQMGIDRSLEGVAAKIGKSFTLMGRWSSQHQWVSRCAAFDAWLDQARVKEQEKLERRAQKVWAERNEQQREDLWKARDLLLQKVTEMAAMPTREIIRQAPDPDNPGAMATIIIKPAQWSFNTMAYLTRTLAEIGNLAVERPTVRTEIEVTGELSMIARIETSEQAQAYLKQLAERIAQRTGATTERALELARQACPDETQLADKAVRRIA